MKRSIQRAARAFVEALEIRRLLASPVLDAISDLNDAPGGKPVFIPLSASDSDNQALTYTISSSNPKIKIDIHKDNVWLKLDIANYGSLTFELFQDIAPRTVATIRSFVEAGFYDGLTFHRIANLGTTANPQFIVQGGDPQGTGSGGPGFQYEDEFNLGAMFTGRGQLAMANSGSDTNGSQFFITQNPTRHLDFKHTIFGQLVRGFDVLASLAGASRDSSDRPTTTITITRATIVQNITDAVVTLTCPAGQSGTVTVQVSDGVNKSFRSFNVKGIADQQNQKPFMKNLPDRLSVRAGKTIKIPCAASDFENDSVIFSGQILAGQATGTFVGHTAYITPDPSFTGLLQVKLSVEGKTASQAANPDSETVYIAVGDQPAKAVQGLTVTAREGVNEKDLVMATFRDSALTGKASDWTAQIRWGDGQTSAGTVTKDANGLFTVKGTHLYKNIGTRTYLVTLTGSKGAYAEATGTVNVVDAPLHGAPGLVVGYPNTALTSVTMATFTDEDTTPLLADFSAEIDWGDGSVPSTGTIGYGTGNEFTVKGTHTYSNPGVYPARVTINSTGGASTRVDVSVRIARTTLIVNLGADASSPEGSTFTRSGSFTDSVGTSWTAKVDYGEGDGFQDLALDGKNFSLSHQYKNSGSFTLTVIVTDENGQMGNDQVSLTVTNVAPSVGAVEGDSLAVRGQTVKITYSATDVSPADTEAGFDFEIDWGDGTSHSYYYNGETTATHAYASAGVFTITVKATDKDFSPAGSATKTIDIRDMLLLPDPIDRTKQALFVGGTAGADTIDIISAGDGKVQVRIAGSLDREPFSPTGRIIVFGGAGNDKITVDPGLARVLEIHGGDGNDTITGSNANNILFGEAGDDSIVGGSGRDIIVGGDGIDRLNGGAGDDILIGGTTRFDADIPKISRIQAEWIRTDRTYAQRVASIRGPVGGLNGDVFLNSASNSFTVFNDYRKNTLTGGAGDDLFFASAVQGFEDKITDKASKETSVSL